MKPTGTGAPVFTAQQLILRVKSRGFLAALHEHKVPADQWPVTHELCGELLLTYAFELPDSFVMLTPAMLESVGLRPEQLEQVALENLRTRLSAQLLSLASHAGLMRVRTGEDLEAVMLCFPKFWSEHVRSHIQGELVVCAPHRAHVLIADTAVPGAVAGLRQTAAQLQAEARDAHGLSQQLMLWTDSGWRLYEAYTRPVEPAP